MANDKSFNPTTFLIQGLCYTPLIIAALVMFFTNPFQMQFRDLLQNESDFRSRGLARVRIRLHLRRHCKPKQTITVCWSHLHKKKTAITFLTSKSPCSKLYLVKLSKLKKKEHFRTKWKKIFLWWWKLLLETKSNWVAHCWQLEINEMGLIFTEMLSGHPQST